MKTKKTKKEFALTGEHEDEIYRVSTFINELSKVQDKYFNDLANILKKVGMSKDEEEFLFDFVYNGELTD